jgi:hypothetical protein
LSKIPYPGLVFEEGIHLIWHADLIIEPSFNKPVTRTEDECFPAANGLIEQQLTYKKNS